ncbi:hypothetical protein Daesc_002356 [Daldinia eschscholtzii]|uniref:Peroxisomal biogenesis factor 11 n=1 Tax=Daldinia eschscholtzii TaxID=292717 RepID=A0AAX6MY00_9PEZI
MECMKPPTTAPSKAQNGSRRSNLPPLGIPLPPVRRHHNRSRQAPPHSAVLRALLRVVPVPHERDAGGDSAVRSAQEAAGARAQAAAPRQERRALPGGGGRGGRHQGGRGAGRGDPVLRYAAVGRQLGYAGYLTFDSATILDALGARKWEGAKRVQKEAYRFWAIGILCSIVAQTYTLYRLREREAKVDKKEGEGVVESKRIAIERATSQLQLVSDLCDLTAPTAALGWIGFDDGFVGLAGTVSSLIGIYTQWKKTA